MFFIVKLNFSCDMPFLFRFSVKQSVSYRKSSFKKWFNIFDINNWLKTLILRFEYVQLHSATNSAATFSNFMKKRNLVYKTVVIDRAYNLPE